MELTFLSADVPLTKTISPTTTTPYVLRRRMTSHTAEVTTPTELHTAIIHHASQGHCLLTGTLERPIVDESRQGLVNSTAPVSLLVFDIDGFPLPEKANIRKALDAVNRLLASIDLALCATAHVVQFSASMGIKPGLRCHVFFMLTDPVPPSALKAWLTWLNLSHDGLSDAVRLNPAGLSLHYVLDPTSADNGRLIYLAPPKLQGGVTSIFEGKYIHFNDGTPSYALNTTFDFATLKGLTQAKLDALREAAALPKREIKTVKKHGVSVIKDPDKALVTSSREEGEFVRCNLNGGDSWGYWHHYKAPEILYNFKDEPAYALDDLDPGYYAMARKNAMDREPIIDNPQGRTYLAFRHRQADAYWNGWYDHDTQTLELSRTKSVERLADFMKSHGQPVPDFISDWTVEYRFDIEQQFDPTNRWINLFQPTEFLRAARRRPDAQCPTTTLNLIRHVMGEDTIAIEHFLNWLACIFQHRVKTGTAWVLSGTQGTGKGLLFNQVLRPLFGDKQAYNLDLSDFDDTFNAKLERVVLLLIDESEIKATTRLERTMAKVKALITEPYISFRGMHAEAYNARNYTNIIFASNKYDSAHVPAGDRRFNVAPRQELKIPAPSVDTLQSLHAERQDFLDYLMSRPANLDLARTPLENDAKRQLQFDSQTSLEVVCQALRDGDLQFFIDDAPPFSAAGAVPREFNGELVDLVTMYRDFVSTALLCAERDEPHYVSRTQMFAVLSTMLETPPKTPNKLTSLLKHHGLYSHKRRINGPPTMAFELRWPRTEDFAEIVKDWRSQHPKKSMATNETE
jgi:hypothetical protein